MPTFKGRNMGQKVSRQIKAKVASRSVMKSMGSKSPETKEEERQETAMARDCVIEIESESKEIKEEEVLVVDPLTTSEEMLLGMARAIIARNETHNNQAELMSKEVEKEDVEPKETKGLIREKRVEELEDVRAEKPLRSPEKSELQNTFEEDKSRIKETSEMPSKGEEPTVPVTPTKETTRSMAGERLGQ